MTKLIANKDTWLKLSEDQSSNLTDLEKHQVKEGDEFKIIASRNVYKGHQYVTFDKGFGPESRNSWYLFRGDFDDEFKDGELRAEFTPLERQDQYGCWLYTLVMRMDGQVWDFECGSGQPGKRPTPINSDWPGSNNPIPQATYDIYKPRYDQPGNIHPGIGPVWIPLEPHQHLNGRAGFLIHLDYNWQYAPGTAGCIFPTRNRDMDTIEEICNRMHKGILDVKYGL